MDSENNYDIVPVNNSCNNVINNNVIVPSPGSDNAKSNQQIESVNNQTDTNAQFDNVDNITVKPLYGGFLKNIKDILFIIKFRNKIVNIESVNEESAVKKFLDNKIFKKDHLLEIIYKNKSSLYVIKNGYKNKFKKIN